MTTQTQTAVRPGYAYGDVTCLNCGRTLAAVVRRLSDLATALRPVRPGQDVAVEVCNGNRLRCKHCGGRAFIELDETATPRSARRGEEQARVA